MKRLISGALSIAWLLSACSGGFTKIGDAGSGGSDTNAGSGGSDTKAGSGGSTPQAGSSPTGGADCNSTADCLQPGAPCEQCPDGSLACPTVECVAGECVGSFPTCSGTACRDDQECPQIDAPCQVCADGSEACPYGRCTNGACVSGIEACPDTNPCAGKACGDSCELCAPGGNCPAVVMYCDQQLQCQYNLPVCQEASCKTDDDCPQVDACPRCPDSDECAEMRCTQGTCGFQCASACSAKGGSCAGGETCCAGLECCAGVPIPEGEEYCGTVCPISDRDMKSEFASVDPDQVLEKLASLPISTWVYKTETAEARHIGPMAQDFMATFGVGSSDRTILQVDADGVAFAAIQALQARLARLEQRNAELERRVQSLTE